MIGRTQQLEDTNNDNQVGQEELNLRNNENDQLFKKEDRVQGSISFSVLNRTLQASGGYFWLAFLCMFLFVVQTSSYQKGRYLLEWAEAYFDKKLPNTSNLIISLIAWSILFIASYAIFTFLIVLSFTWYSRSLHSKIMYRIMHSDLTKFIQRTSIGIILNRISYDVLVLDVSYPLNIYVMTTFLFSVFTDLYTIIVGVVSIFALIPCFLFLFIGVMVRGQYMAAQREMKRLELITKSPVVGLASSTIAGGPIIRSMGLKPFFTRELGVRIHENTKNLLLSLGLSNWFTVRIALFNFAIMSIPLYSILLFSLYQEYKPDDNTGGDRNYVDTANFILSVLSFTEGFVQALSNICIIETNLVSAERCKTYEEVDLEAGYSKKIENEQKILENLTKKSLKNASELIVGRNEEATIFTRGEIEIDQIYARYPTSTKDILKGVSVKIEAGQKVGIVGRTGAGKSSFTKLLWRILDYSLGTIKIDGCDIKSIGLKSLREEFNIILQKPSLFEGTIRSNIFASSGPDEQPDDLRIQQIKAELLDLGFPKDKAEFGRLDYAVEAGGDNLSQSEKQVISMVQALQKRSKVVILDEATAYVDSSVADRFQEKLLGRFRESTVLIIAHRLGSIIDCDRVLVFSDGVIAEDGVPRELVESGKGLFWEMWNSQ